MVAKAGKYNGYLLEGMACPGGCIGGAGTLAPLDKAAAEVAKNKKNAPYQGVLSSNYRGLLEALEE